VAVNLAPIEGVISLKDEFTSTLGLASAALSNFTARTQESLKAIGEATALVTAAFGAVVAATIELGKHGSEIADIDSTLDHFAGSASKAADIMGKLRETTKNSVGDFDLAKDAAKLLGAGVQLSVDQFGILGNAAEALRNRMGSTKEALETISEALITGRTRALARTLGVVDAGDAEAAFAAKLGVTKDKLNDLGLAEAKRQAVMDLLSRAVKEAGVQEADFKQRLEQAETVVENWIDGLAKAVAQSKVFSAGMKEVSVVFNEAFGGDQLGGITETRKFLENVGIAVTNVGLAFVETARVIHAAWSAVSVTVNTVEAGIIGLAGIVAGTINTIAQAAAGLPGASQGMKQFAESTRTAVEVTNAMRDSLLKEATAAADGVVGQSEFDKSLDKVGGTIMRVKDAMIAAQAESNKTTEAHGHLTDGANKMAGAIDGANSKFLDQTKIQAALVKSSNELAELWSDYTKKVVAASGTSRDAQEADIEAVKQKQINALDALDPLYAAKYKAIEANAKASLDAIGSEWDSVKDKSLEALQQQYDKANQTYEQMLTSGLHFTREVLDAQVQKIHDAADAMRGLGSASQAAMAAAQAATEKQNAALEKQKKDADAAAAANRALAGSFSYDLTTREGVEQYRKMNPAAGISWSDDQIIAYASKGGTLEGLIKTGVINPYSGFGSMKGFAEGGTVDVITGERGPEVARVPLGTTFYGSSRPAPASGQTVIQNYYVNGTAVEVYKKIKDLMVNDLKFGRQVSALR
jgi:hypothetical protein